MQFVYIIGAQCTGKTTLSQALADILKTNWSGINCELLSETARTTLQLHGYTREDVRMGGERCLQLQKLIIESQHERETRARQLKLGLVISDRSGIDPIVYARMYCGIETVEEWLAGDTWSLLKSTMQNGIVVVCEPVQEWLFDDGTRLIPLDWEEWKETHRLFCELLLYYEIEYVVLPAAIRSLQDRVDFVLRRCRIQGDASSPNEGGQRVVNGTAQTVIR